MAATDWAQRFREADGLFPARPAEALEAVEALLPGIEASGEAELLAQCLALKGNALAQLGRFDEAEAHIATAEPRLQELGDERGQVAMLNLRGVIASRRSDYVGSIRHYQQALQRARHRQSAEVVANLAGNLGLNLAYLGEFSAALIVLEESLALWREVDDPARMIPTLINLGFTCTRAGMLDAALGYFEDAHRRAVAAGDVIRQVVALSNTANQLGELGRLDEARERSAQAVALARTQPSQLPLAHALESWASAERAAGNPEEARAALGEALGLYEEAGNRRGIAVTELYLAKLPECSPAERARGLRRALQAAEQAGLRPEQAEVRGLLAELAEEQGDLPEACRQLKAARGLDRALYTEEAQRRLSAIQVQRDIESLRRELEVEAIRRREMTSLLDEVQDQRQRAEEESRQKTAILRIAAHDLRSAMSGVLGCLELADDGFSSGESPASLHEWVREARGAAEELFGLLERIMDLAAIDRGEVSIEPELVELRTVLEPVFHRWKPAAAAKEQALQVSGGGDAWIHADPDRLRQMVANLISNAVKYSPIGRPIDVRIEAISTGHRLVVADRGPGLSAEDRECMSRPFQTLSARPTAGEQSTGLGLHIVDGLARRQGAAFGYRDRPGGGSEFYLDFTETERER